MYYYKLLNAHKRHFGWITACNSLEKVAIEYATTDVFCGELFKDDIKKPLKPNIFNRLKQFMFRLYRNNLYLNKNAHKWKKDDNDKCWACSKDSESCFHLFGKCEKMTQIFQYLTRVLQNVGYLQNASNVGVFLCKNYRSN